MSDVDTETRKRIRRSTIVLVAIAVTFYLGFILAGVLRA